MAIRLVSSFTGRLFSRNGYNGVHHICASDMLGGFTIADLEQFKDLTER
jgi:hypothetical protein